ncbi:MAG: alpha/beta fold hydrolase [Anaerolineae bacterium]
MKARRYYLRLLTFALSLFIIIPAALVFGVAYATASAYISPAPSSVSRPPDLPFVVEDVSFMGGDDVTLRGWYTPPSNGVVIIVLHGYDSNRLSMMFHAEALTQAGYGVLMYDERGHGMSDVTQRSFGWRDVEDVGGALAFLDGKRCAGEGKTCVRTVALVGCSIGGQIGLRAAAHYPEIRAVLADGPAIVSAADLPPADGLKPSTIWDSLIDRFLELRLGTAAPAPVVEVIDEIAPRPILLIAGAAGKELEPIRYYRERAGDKAQIWEVPGATHCDGPSVAPEEYARRMVAFFDEATSS